MDPNNPTPAQNPQVNPQGIDAQPAVSAVPMDAPMAQGQAQPTVETASPKKSRMVFFVIGALILLILIAAVAYFLLLRQKSDVGVVPTPSPQEANILESELNSIPSTNVDQEFSQVDSDLQSL